MLVETIAEFISSLKFAGIGIALTNWSWIFMGYFDQLCVQHLRNKENKSGFFDLDEPLMRPCHDPSHNFPDGLYIAPGKGYKHVCPTCGYTEIATNRNGS